jgi:hypothetical protein
MAFFLLQNSPASELINISCAPAVTYAQMDRVILIASLLGCNQMQLLWQIKNSETCLKWNMGIMEPAFNQKLLESSGTKFQAPVSNGSYLHWAGGNGPLQFCYRQVSLYQSLKQKSSGLSRHSLISLPPPPRGTYG